MIEFLSARAGDYPLIDGTFTIIWLVLFLWCVATWEDQTRMCNVVSIVGLIALACSASALGW